MGTILVKTFMVVRINLLDAACRKRMHRSQTGIMNPLSHSSLMVLSPFWLRHKETHGSTTLSVPEHKTHWSRLMSRISSFVPPVLTRLLCHHGSHQDQCQTSIFSLKVLVANNATCVRSTIK